MEGLHFVALARHIGTHEVVHHGPVIVDDEVQPELHRAGRQGVATARYGLVLVCLDWETISSSVVGSTIFLLALKQNMHHTRNNHIVPKTLAYIRWRQRRIKGFSNLMGIFSIKVKPIKIFCTSKWNLFSIKMFREIPYMQIYMESKFSLHASK